jgi:hypothetical protein
LTWNKLSSLKKSLLQGKLRIKGDAGRYALELICLPSRVNQGTLERYLGQKHIDYSGLQGRANQGSTVKWTIGFDDNILRALQLPNNWVTP